MYVPVWWAYIVPNLVMSNSVNIAKFAAIGIYYLLDPSAGFFKKFGWLNHIFG